MSESANGQANMPGQDGAGGPDGAAPGTPEGAAPAGGSAAGSARSGRAAADGAAAGSAPVGALQANGAHAGAAQASAGNGSVPAGMAPGGAAPGGAPRGVGGGLHGTHYKWLALSNTTLGMLAATVNASIVIISLPAIFRGIKLNPLTPGNVSYLLWMLMGYLVVSAVLVVTLGRLGDIYGRV